MATSPIYSWPEPDNTDLVKNGALAIRTLGDAIDTTMGTMVAKTIVDAKGDLIAGTAADTVNRLAVGNNGETLVADSSTSTGLRWQGNYVAGKNFFFNGAMDIWQRGTSITTSGGYTADRWQQYTTGVQTTSRQTTSDTTNLPQIQYCARVQRNSGSTSTGVFALGTSLESVMTTPMAGQTVTLSFYGRKGANFSGTNLVVQLIGGTGTDQNVVSGFTGATVINGSQTATLTSTWQRFTWTFSVSSTYTQLGLQTYFLGVGTAGANDYYEITGIQLELGSVATTFSRAGGNIQGELAACQRYYESYAFGSDGVLPAQAISTTAAYGSLSYKVRKRGNPTIAATGGTFQVWNAGATSIGATFQADSIGVDTARVAAVSASGLVAGNAANLYFPSMTITISAEL